MSISLDMAKTRKMPFFSSPHESYSISILSYQPITSHRGHVGFGRSYVSSSLLYLVPWLIRTHSLTPYTCITHAHTPKSHISFLFLILTCATAYRLRNCDRDSHLLKISPLFGLSEFRLAQEVARGPMMTEQREITSTHPLPLHLPRSQEKKDEEVKRESEK